MLINKNQPFFKLTLITFLIIMLISIQSGMAAQDVYEYINKQGVTEFTDELKSSKTPESHIQIEEMTLEEEALSKQKLDKIMEKDAELDKRLARERQIENKRRQEFEQQQALKNRQEPQVEDNGGDNDSLRNDWYYGRPVRPGNPGIPTKPINRPKSNPGRSGGSR